MLIQLVIVLSIGIRVFALFRAIKLVYDLKDWRMSLLSLLVGAALVRQVVGYFGNLDSPLFAPGDGMPFELFGLAASLLILGLVLFVDNLVSRYQSANEVVSWQNRQLLAAESFARVGGWSYNIVTKEREWSDGLIRLLGLCVDDEELKSLPYDKIIHPEDLSAFTDYLQAFFSGREPINGIQHRTHPDNGPVRFLSTHFELVNDEEGQPRWVYGLTHDISELKTRELELRKRNRELNLLHSIGLKLTRHINLSDVFYIVVKTLVETLDEIDGACVWLPAEEENRFVVRACYARTGDEEALLESMGHSPELLRLINENRDITCISDTLEDPVFQKLAEPMSRIKSMAGTSLVVNNESFGFIIVVSFSKTNAITMQNVLWLTGVSNEVSVAIEKAQLFEQKERLARQRLNDIEDERRRLALELHDELGAELTSLGLKLHRGGEDKLLVQDAIASINTLIEKVRSMSLELRPMLLDDLGLVPALEWLFNRYTKQTGIKVGFYEELTEKGRLDIELETVAFRVVQEAITNAAKHADVNEVQVLIHHDASNIAIHVIDEGRGFNATELNRYLSVGIEGMRERVSLLHGTFDIVSESGIGTRITVTLPVAYHS